MKNITAVAGALLGFLFNFVALNYFFQFMEMPPPPAGSPASMFLGAMIPTGYFAFVKTCEIVGGILVAIPRTAPLGMIFLGPVIVNILCFHIFLLKGEGIVPLPLLVTVLGLVVLWGHRDAFAAFIPGAGKSGSM